MIRKAGLVGLLNRRSRKERDLSNTYVKINTLLKILRKSQALARIFTIVNKVKIYIRVKINGTIRIWQKSSYAYT
ncbi:hypothetical protein NSTC731_04800 [Nostoc sp. DSM 114167]|jgi:hypothetical protein